MKQGKQMLGSKKEVKNNQNTKQEKEKIVRTMQVCIDRSGSFALDAPSCAFGDASPIVEKIQRGTYRNEVNQTETKTTR